MTHITTIEQFRAARVYSNDLGRDSEHYQNCHEADEPTVGGWIYDESYYIEDVRTWPDDRRKTASAEWPITNDIAHVMLGNYDEVTTLERAEELLFDYVKEWLADGPEPDPITEMTELLEQGVGMFGAVEPPWAKRAEAVLQRVKTDSVTVVDILKVALNELHHPGACAYERGEEIVAFLERHIVERESRS